MNGSALAARHDVVVVTVSYRLGALGFLTTAEGDFDPSFDPPSRTGNGADNGAETRGAGAGGAGKGDGVGTGGMNGLYDMVVALKV